MDFFRHCATFFLNLFCLQRVPPLVFLLFKRSLQNRRMSVKGAPFVFFGTVRHFLEVFCLQRVPPSILLLYLSLRYSADLRRSCLVRTLLQRKISNSVESKCQIDRPVMKSSRSRSQRVDG